MVKYSSGGFAIEVLSLGFCFGLVCRDNYMDAGRDGLCGRKEWSPRGVWRL